MSTALTVDVRMYHVGELGDCFLLRFTEGRKQSNVLIDCGSFRNGEKSQKRLKTVVADIKETLAGKKLDLIVGTHQHNDHLSGFVHCEAQFEGLVDQVWLSWLDNPKDKLARQIASGQQQLVGQLITIRNKLTALDIKLADPALEDMLGFYAADVNGAPGLPAMGIEVLKRIGDKEPAYLSPGQVLGLPGMTEDQVKVYVLGPPRNREQLFDKDPGKGESYDKHLALANISAAQILSALDNMGPDPQERNKHEEQFPFNKIFTRKREEANKDILALYNNTESKWRQIDTQWLNQAGRLALYLDSYTNNSSLVLAFELVKSGKVLLFAADAQTGNWLSWEQIKWKGAPEGFNTYRLLENTVLYKVGHHGSHNATLVKALEAMQHEELVAMIPVDEKDPNITKVNGWKMPAPKLFRRLVEKTQHRVLRMDMGFAAGCRPGNGTGAWEKLPFMPEVKEGVYVEYRVKG